MSRKKWITAHIDKEIAAQVAENHSLDPFTALIVVSRGITEYEDVEEFFETDFSFCDPYLIVDMEKAVERINLALDHFPIRQGNNYPVKAPFCINKSPYSCP